MRLVMPAIALPKLSNAASVGNAQAKRNQSHSTGPQPIKTAADICRSTLFECRARLERHDERWAKSGGWRDQRDWQDWIEQRCVDFNAWCSTAGVFAEAEYCLDERLRLREETRLSLASFVHLFHTSVLTLLRESPSTGPLTAECRLTPRSIGRGYIAISSTRRL